MITGCGPRAGVEVETTAAVAPLPADEIVYLQPHEDDPRLRPRWRDVADYPYPERFRTSFRYVPDTVELRYTTTHPLQFTVTAPAHSLKPNFCYQMKLWGPLVPWPADPQATNFANWALGTRGRWSDGVNNLLIKDADLAQHVGRTMHGYLYFDYFVTAPDGSVQYTGRVDSSYHVTWKTSQRAPSGRDGPLRTFPVVTRGYRWAYDRAFPQVDAHLFGEAEPYRPAPGRLVLPAGTYRGVQFVLTEESFHSRREDGGVWRTVLQASLPEFTLP